ncbi:MAG: hypothetical protein LQ348_002195 [Seirophora lacunosa]|nr:MAG: hypothetical protein LQ348_002195 [Seirophora lacunosa]
MGFIALRHSFAKLLLGQLCIYQLTGMAQSLVIGRPGNNTFDYVIVGGGNAGLTMASRLSEEASVRVAVIEAGGYYETTSGNFSTIPGNDVYYNGKDPKDTNALLDWGFTTTPQKLGGCTALNYMAYERTTRGALQKWAEDVGDPSWAYDDVSAYYSKSISFAPPDMTKRIANSTPDYDISTLGTDGPLKIAYPNYAQAISTWFARAMRTVGILPVDGFTTGALNGSAFLVSAINHTNGHRDSSETAFLRPFLGRPNLFVFNDTMADKIVFDGTTATGVQVSSGNSTPPYVISAAKEVIVSAGVFQSPQLLQVSGVGPAGLLNQHGIKVVANRPGVGQGMQDHTFYGITYRVNVQTGTALSYGNNLQQAIEQFQTEQSGILSSPGGDFGAYEKIPQNLRSNFSRRAQKDLATLPSDWPELEYFSLPNYVGDFQDPTKNGIADGYQYATLMAVNIAPQSRGTITISSASTRDQPLINPNWLTHPTDAETVIAGFKRIRDIFGNEAMHDVTIGPEFYPGRNVTSDEEILAYIKRAFNTMYHAASTNKMGKSNDHNAVVDSRARVYGTKNLRVVDASVFPFLPPGLPMGTVYMVAEKIADDIKMGR